MQLAGVCRGERLWAELRWGWGAGAAVGMGAALLPARHAARLDQWRRFGKNGSMAGRGSRGLRTPV